MLDVGGVVVEAEGKAEDAGPECEDDSFVDQVPMQCVDLGIIRRVVATTSEMARRHDVGEVGSRPPPDDGHTQVHESIREVRRQSTDVRLDPIDADLGDPLQRHSRRRHAETVVLPEVEAPGTGRVLQRRFR